jgi:quinolinate synthase
MMKQNRALPSPRSEVAPEEGNMEASKSFKAVHLRLQMKEREEVVNQLVHPEYPIWVLEESFRVGSQ